MHSSLHLSILECDVSGAAVYSSMHLCLRRMNKVAGIGRSIYATPHSHSNWDPNDGLSTKMNMKNHNSCCLEIINNHIPKKTANHLWWVDSDAYEFCWYILNFSIWMSSQMIHWQKTWNVNVLGGGESISFRLAPVAFLLKQVTKINWPNCI